MNRAQRRHQARHAPSQHQSSTVDVSANFSHNGEHVLVNFNRSISGLVLSPAQAENIIEGLLHAMDALEARQKMQAEATQAVLGSVGNEACPA